MEQESITMEIINPQAAGMDVGSRFTFGGY
jgi:hypothetical protein